ncbi:MAG: class I SAM-dependent RNA methyltransferase [candidate division Zixibacteria bacterium]|nr:class I SAM-dependent RNA methyltransferase [candidate division Zixibacteria bacterium]
MPTKTRNSKQPFRMIAKTLFGLEKFLARELTDLGACDVKCLNRSIEFLGDKRTLYEANLWCRTATRILKPFASFKAANEKELYQEVYKIDWEKYLGIEQTFAIDAVITKSQFTNSLYVAQKTKDAIVDQFRDKAGRRPSVELNNPDIRINIYIYQNECRLAIDSSGEPLFKRGYRKKTGKAPLNEVLAAGLVLQSEWDKKSSFVDAMCGSGTIVIEAALLARNIAPGLTRKQFGFMNWPDYDQEMFDSICKKARQAVIPELNFKIVGADLRDAAIYDSKDNAKEAGVVENITFKHSAIKDLIPPESPGVLIINPPYGERISIDEIEELYNSIGDAFKRNFTGYDAFVFTGNLDAAKKIGLRTSRRIQMYNGSIECRLLKFEMYSGSRK